MNPPKDHLPTVMALAVIAACISTFAHEAVGHGGFCIAMGGRISQLSSVYFQCRPDRWPIAAAGPMGNIVWSLVATTIASNLRGNLRLLFTLTALFSLGWEAGYMLYAAALNDGDYIFALRGVFGDTTPLMRTILGVIGLALYLVSATMARALMRPFATEPGRRRAVLRAAWIAATGAVIAAALLYAPDRFGAARQAFLEIGAASAPLLLIGREGAGGDAPPLRASFFWIVAASAIFIVFALTLGRGVVS